MEKVEAIAKHLDMAFPGIISAGAKYCSLQGDLLAGVTRRYKSSWLCCAVLVLVTIWESVKTVMAAKTAALEISSLDTAALVPSIHWRFFS